MMLRIILVLALTGGSVIGAARAATPPGSVGGPAKHNAGVVAGKPIVKQH